ncbi:MAG: FCD domain-containing protein [Hyphomicrobiaceae bacterium]
METTGHTRLKQLERPVREEVLSIAKQLFTLIESDHYPFGTRLPAERQLAEEFAVTRNTVRDALDLLERNEIISRRAGSGSFITYRAPTSTEASDGANQGDAGVAENTGPLELQVVRSMVEPEMVRLAVIQMAPKDIDTLRGLLEQMEANCTDPEQYARCEELFYLQIARATENPLLTAIYELITKVRRQSHWAASRRKLLSPNRIRDNQRRHRSLFEAIEQRDIESAMEYAKLQLVEEQRIFMQDG